LKDFKELKPGEILALTGQVHGEDFKYDKVIIMYVGGNTYLNQQMLDSDDTRCVRPVVAAVCGINLKEHRIVDIAVHPYFRKMGFGSAIVELAVQEYGVALAYTVEEEAEEFWKAVGWVRIGTRVDKGTEVEMWTPEVSF